MPPPPKEKIYSTANFCKFYLKKGGKTQTNSILRFKKNSFAILNASQELIFQQITNIHQIKKKLILNLLKKMLREILAYI